MYSSKFYTISLYQLISHYIFIFTFVSIELFTPNLYQLITQLIKVSTLKMYTVQKKCIIIKLFSNKYYFYLLKTFMINYHNIYIVQTKIKILYNETLKMKGETIYIYSIIHSFILYTKILLYYAPSQIYVELLTPLFRV